ncbi:MAG TPA: thioesterase family protein [Ornithinibacter sp.]|nr:thioesterase family protein [Ornithinibacter sp.]
MVSDDDGYFTPTGDGLAPVPEARSPWSPDMLHGRLLAGLAARAVEQHPDVDRALRLTRLTVDMYRFPPMAAHQVRAKVVRQGHRVGAVDVSITAGGNEVARASALLLRIGPAPVTRAWRAPEWDVPGPDEVRALSPPDGTEPAPGGWDIRLVNPGGFWSDERKQVWARDDRPLVAGERLTPLVRAGLAADLPNPLANAGAEGLSFINADLTLFLARPPRSEWIGLEVAHHLAADGVAIGSCTLYDLEGALGWSSVCAVANEAMPGT